MLWIMLNKRVFSRLIRLRTCKYCGKEITGESPKAIFCSKHCSGRYYNGCKLHKYCLSCGVELVGRVRMKYCHDCSVKIRRAKCLKLNMKKYEQKNEFFKSLSIEETHEYMMNIYRGM